MRKSSKSPDVVSSRLCYMPSVHDHDDRNVLLLGTMTSGPGTARLQSGIDMFYGLFETSHSHGTQFGLGPWTATRGCWRGRT